MAKKAKRLADAGAAQKNSMLQYVKTGQSSLRKPLASNDASRKIMLSF